jgi:hypothetical protein
MCDLYEFICKISSNRIIRILKVLDNALSLVYNVCNRGGSVMAQISIRIDDDPRGIAAREFIASTPTNAKFYVSCQVNIFTEKHKYYRNG